MTEDARRHNVGIASVSRRWIHRRADDGCLHVAESGAAERGPDGRRCSHGEQRRAGMPGQRVAGKAVAQDFAARQIALLDGGAFRVPVIAEGSIYPHAIRRADAMKPSYSAASVTFRSAAQPPAMVSGQFSSFASPAPRPTGDVDA